MSSEENVKGAFLIAKLFWVVERVNFLSLCEIAVNRNVLGAPSK